MIEEYERRSYLSKGSYNSDSAGNPIPAAQGTFGWGGVNDEFPTENQNQKMYHFYKDGDVFKLCKCGLENGAHTENCRQTSYHEYDTIWRYER